MKFKLLETKDYFDDYADYDFIYDGKTVVPENARKVMVLEEVTEIPSRSFEDSSIETIVIPSSVKRIGWDAFANCRNLNYVELSNGLNTIESGAFERCQNLTHIYIPSTVSKINPYIFYDCTSLTDIILSNNISILPEYMLSGCIKLQELFIPDTVSIIDEGCFNECYNLDSISMPEKLKIIDLCAFKGCKKLFDIEFRGTCKQWRDVKKYCSYPHITVHCTDGQTPFS